MNVAHIKSFCDQMIQGVTGIQKEIQKSVEQGFANMSEEEKKKFAEAMQSSDIIATAKAQAEKIIEMNKRKTK